MEKKAHADAPQPKDHCKLGTCSEVRCRLHQTGGGAQPAFQGQPSLPAAEHGWCGEARRGHDDSSAASR